mmetsp:Transcript_7257/g.12276  ORF Transcript_7257/g.12276 Transcript_7257/m.12276 type:complete len:120 (-) Transcript_7257:288-647(-)|eukprot:CAMPEP_0119301686 /NCGR_PEP_ID=MMETSP1333-20130426/3424_1 /TAXON_ID=418940 /ORGANISM="Scyphosphaera apsteinii, Strain RCC1455" /LENGTH=119 /DNA_ID=CAMNT_0007303823 /DNA_START=234 /DNA_END=593 /DNA_ORIENTATION=-
MPGVVSSSVGYTGGDNPNPTYESVCRGDGHTEALKIEYDPSVLSFQDLMTTFFKEADGGRCKAQYMSAVFAQNKEQAAIAKKVAKDSNSNVPVLGGASAKPWHDAEEYHQKYMAKALSR